MTYRDALVNQLYGNTVRRKAWKPDEVLIEGLRFNTSLMSTTQLKTEDRNAMDWEVVL